MDIYDGTDWTEMDVEDLKAAIEGGDSFEEAAEFRCRADSVDDVARKCEELGLKAEGPIMSKIDADKILGNGRSLKRRVRCPSTTSPVRKSAE